ncbi:hypothetical protein SAMN06265222_101220 [Neorhodopirellula lusitana]|uniref:Uncharacterized protein n=1 Tax=Neorhodopirellula lusitana TaxID=445327 RepID=A0ABY1PPH4_9BACT|nr:hypothetical protein [Neorhodopirellula lusitana]SMP38947.1 hypothetical protein SAMN06265222_101220 [Neorhodopirellula lusitana]
MKYLMSLMIVCFVISIAGCAESGPEVVQPSADRQTNPQRDNGSDMGNEG